MKQRFKFRRTTIIIMGLVAFLAGLGLARLRLDVHGQWILLAVTILVITLPRLRLGALLSVILLGLLLGIGRGSFYMQELAPYDQLKDEKVIVRVTAESDGVYDDRGQLTFDGGHITLAKPYELQLKGKIKISGFGEPAIYRGDVVQVEGKLFRTRGARQASISFAEIHVLGRSGSFIERTRLNFLAGMLNALPEPQASFALGLLIGQRSTLPDNVTAALATAGLTHIIAVSGYNLTIIIRAVRRLTNKRSKYQATVISAVLIILFLLFTGFSASIVRAAIVSGLSLLAWYYGRTFPPLLLLLLTAAITAGWYPVYLWSDIGWYLSFLAFFGVLVLAPLLTARFFKKQPKLLSGVIIESLCAQIMTIPLILFIFNETSAIALLSNAIIVPMVPIAMMLALISGLAGMLAPALAGWIAWPARILLTYVLDMVQILGRIPKASVRRSLSLGGMIVLYCIIAFVCFVLWRRSLKNAKITDKETIV